VSSRASPPHRPREDGLIHPADTSRTNLASVLGLLPSWRLAKPLVGWATTQGLLAVHAVTATPWWLTIVGTTVLLRTAMIPITLHSMRATVQLSPIIQDCFGRCSSSPLTLTGRIVHHYFVPPSSVTANRDRPQQVSLKFNRV
jgi:hypothetical protein